MAIILNHTIVPARDEEASARFFAGIFGLKYEGASGHIAPVRVNETLTLDFDDGDRFDIHHYAFHVSDVEFDDILKRVQEAGLSYGSDPWNLENKELNSWNGGRGVFFSKQKSAMIESM